MAKHLCNGGARGYQATRDRDYELQASHPNLYSLPANTEIIKVRFISPTHAANYNRFEKSYSNSNISNYRTYRPIALILFVYGCFSDYPTKRCPYFSLELGHKHHSLFATHAGRVNIEGQSRLVHLTFLS